MECKPLYSPDMKQVGKDKFGLFVENSRLLAKNQPRFGYIFERIELRRPTALESSPSFAQKHIFIRTLNILSS